MRRRDNVCLLNSYPEMMQGYESILSNLQIINSTMPIKSLLVTGAQPGEGKTTVAVNLAFAMGLAGKKVLLIDADLRNPHIHQMLGVSRAPGLSDILRGDRGPEEVIQTADIEYKDLERTVKLNVITSGRRPRDLFRFLKDFKFKTDIAYLRNIYDLVLLDSPPALAVNDALLLASMVDGIILVLACGVVTEKDAKLTKERLEQAGGRLLGVVMNRFVAGLHGQESHPYRDYYDTTLNGKDAG